MTAGAELSPLGGTVATGFEGLQHSRIFRRPVIHNKAKITAAANKSPPLSAPPMMAPIGAGRLMAPSLGIELDG